MKERCYNPKFPPEWAENLGINLRTLKNRIDSLGWSIERAFEEEVK